MKNINSLVLGSLLTLFPALVHADVHFSSKLNLDALTVEFLDRPPVSYSISSFQAGVGTQEKCCAPFAENIYGTPSNPIDVAIVSPGGASFSFQANPWALQFSGNDLWSNIGGVYVMGYAIVKFDSVSQLTGKVRITVPYQYEISRDDPKKEQVAVGYTPGNVLAQFELLHGPDLTESGSGIFTRDIDLKHLYQNTIPLRIGGWVQVVPEPETYALMTAGLMVMIATRRKKLAAVLLPRR